MIQKSLFAGAILVVIGIVVSLLSDSGSVTSLITAFLGVIFVAIGLVGRSRSDLNKHLRHVAAAEALRAIVGSPGSAVGRSGRGWALFAQLATVVVAGAFLFIAVQSFRSVCVARATPTVNV